MWKESDLEKDIQYTCCDSFVCTKLVSQILEPQLCVSIENDTSIHIACPVYDTPLRNHQLITPVIIELC